jgi:hypothetical protein
MLRKMASASLLIAVLIQSPRAYADGTCQTSKLLESKRECDAALSDDNNAILRSSCHKLEEFSSACITVPQNEHLRLMFFLLRGYGFIGQAEGFRRDNDSNDAQSFAVRARKDFSKVSNSSAASSEDKNEARRMLKVIDGS